MKRIMSLLLITAILLCGCSSGSSGAAGDLDMERIAAAAAPKLGASNSVEGTGVYPQWDDGGVLDAATLESSFTKESGDDLVLLTVSQKTKTAETKEGTTAFTRRHDEVSLQSTWYPDQEERINEQIDTYLQRRLDQADNQETEAVEACQAAEEAGKACYGWTSYCDITAQRVDNSYVSVVAYNSVYLGGAHPSNDQAAMNFDLTTGSLLSLSSIFKTEYKDAILRKLLSKLSEMKSSFQLFEGYETTVQEKFEQMPADMTQNWYLTDRSIVFFYNPYEISPYASGVVSVELSLAELVGFLRDDFSWPDRDQEGDNSLIVTSQVGSVKSGAYDRVIEVTAGQGAKLALTTEGEIRNLRVDLVQVAGDTVVSSDMVLAVNRLMDQEALILTLPADSENGQSTTGVQLSYDISYRQAVKQVFTVDGDGAVVVEETVDGE